MTNTVFSMFQTRYILDFFSASLSTLYSGTLGFSKHWDFQSKDVASGLVRYITWEVSQIFQKYVYPFYPWLRFEAMNFHIVMLCYILSLQAWLVYRHNMQYVPYFSHIILCTCPSLRSGQFRRQKSLGPLKKNPAKWLIMCFPA
jgi:hypothetical protein